MDKELLKTIIIENQRLVSRVSLVDRLITLEKNANYVFLGVRRAGKSYLLYQIIQSLLKEGRGEIRDILFINFEDERLCDTKAQELGGILDAYKELYNKTPIVFLDEIQNVIGWEKFARRLADSKHRVFVTGSNAKMLSKEIYTTLGGRYLSKEVFPFSFGEYLTFHNVVLDKNWCYSETKPEVVRLFQNYFYFGGFAESFQLNDKRNYITSLYHKILLGDIIARNNIRHENAIKVLMKKIAESVMQPQSLSRLANIVASIGAPISRVTLNNYLRNFEDAYLVFSISNFSDKLSNKETFKKRYFMDNGLLNNFLIDPNTKLLENLVAITLKKRFGENLFFYKRNVEVDFYMPEASYAVQASLSIREDTTKEREVRSLMQLAELKGLKRLEIVTMNEEDTVEQNGHTINVVPIWKWLLV